MIKRCLVVMVMILAMVFLGFPVSSYAQSGSEEATISAPASVEEKERIEDNEATALVAEMKAEEADVEWKPEGNDLVASGECGENLNWKVDKDGTLTISGTGEMYDYGYAIDWNRFVNGSAAPWLKAGCIIKNIVVEEGVTSIGVGAFTGVGLNKNGKVYKDEEDYAYYFDSITLPDSLKAIHGKAFINSGCESIIIPDSVNELGKIVIDSWIEYSSAFEHSCFSNITLGRGVDGIPDNTFKSCTMLEHIIIPDTVEYIKNRAFESCKSLKQISIPSSVKMIYQEAFRSCESLEEITIPPSVTNIGYMCFNKCSALKNVFLSEGLVTIGQYAFYDCIELDKIAIPSTVRGELLSYNSSISPCLRDTFRNCTSLREVIFVGETYELSLSCVFVGCTNLKSIEIPHGVTSLDADFLGCESLEEVIIPDTVTKIYGSTFSECKSLKSLTIPKSVEYIETKGPNKNSSGSAFSECVSLLEITVDPQNQNYSSYGGCLYDKGLTELLHCPQGREEIIIPFTVLKVNGIVSDCSLFFYGDMPDAITHRHSKDGIFSPEYEELNLTIYYPSNNSTWTASAISAYSESNIIWKQWQPDISKCKVMLSEEMIVYDGAEKCPDTIVISESLSLTKGDDYLVTYANNINAGKATISIIGKGKYIGSISKTFTISKTDPILAFANNFVSKKTTDSPFTNQLMQKTDGTVVFSSSNTGVAIVSGDSGLVTVRGNGTTTITANASEGSNYNAGSASYTLSVSESEVDIVNCNVTISPTEYTYDGEAKQPSVTVTYGSGTLRKEDDYSVTYVNNTNAGIAAVSITGRGKYIGSVSKTFIINKADPVLVFANESVSKKTTDSPFTNKLTHKTDGVLSFLSSNTSTAIVDSDSGQVTIKETGTTVITASAATGRNYNADIASYTLIVTKPKSYIITFDANGGTGAPTSQEKEENVPLKLSSEKPVKQYAIIYNANGGQVSAASKNLSCSYNNWNTERDGSGKVFYSEDNYIDNADATLYAQWINPKAGTLETPTRSGYKFIGWFTSPKGGQQITESSTVTGNITLYAQWMDPYNMGDETYSFENYGDDDSPNGHCFGMSITSAAYHNELLDIRKIGGDKDSSLYSLSESPIVKEPICYYQIRQGKSAKAAIVAGSTHYSDEINSIASDWPSVVNYVKNHEYDNKGILQIGFGNHPEGGHAINFIRYENINGQDRLYAYDNNFPNQETYLYMDAYGRVIQAPNQTFSGTIDCIALRDVRIYFNNVDNFDVTHVIYAPKEAVVVQGYTYSYMEGEFADEEYVMYEIAADQDRVIIIPKRDHAKFIYMDKEYSFGEVTDDTRGEFELLAKGQDYEATYANFVVYEEKTGTGNKEAVTEFVTRLYSNFLLREPDKSGINSWVDVLLDGTATGAKVVVGFVHSEEFRNQPLDNRDYITALYKVILGREPDLNGINAWLKVVENGYTKDKVLEGFLNSPEMEELCNSIGVQPGKYKSKHILDEYHKVTEFVMRLYQNCLGRRYDEAGLNNWVNVLVSGDQDGYSVAIGFFTSVEMNNKNLNDAEYIAICYRTLLGREPETDGMKTWVNFLKDAHNKKEDVVLEFCKSVEFNSLCASYGIKAFDSRLTN